MFNRLPRTILVVLLLGALTVAVTAGPALAAKGGNGRGGGGGGTSGGYGSCAVTPNPVAVGGKYTVNGSGFKPYELVTVWVSDSHGTQVLFPPVSSTGTFSISSYASWAGTSTATVYDNGGRSLVYLTACSFQVG